MKVLLLGAGGAAGIGFTRALHEAGHDVIGTDITEAGVALSEADETHLLPAPDDPGRSPAFWRLVSQYRPDLIHAQPDEEVLSLSRLRHTTGMRYMLPSHQTVLTCQDKWESYGLWKAAGVPVPQTSLVTGPAQVPQRSWLRPRRGAGGAKSFLATTREEAMMWVAHHHGWGQFTAAEILPGPSVTVQMLWRKGWLVCSQQRERESWANAKSSPTGVTGSTGIGVTASDPDVDDTAILAVKVVSAEPHGLYGVDMTLDAAGNPRVTEINVGRFFTTASEFYMRAGFNMPAVYVAVATGGHFRTPYPDNVNPLDDGQRWIRSMDREPVLA